MSSLNPFTILDSILEDYASPRVRRLIHLLLTFVVAVVTIYFGVDGEWKEFVIALAATVYTAANKANTHDTDEFEFYDTDDGTGDGVSGNDDPEQDTPLIG